jgi:hypothetical protein
MTLVGSYSRLGPFKPFTRHHCPFFIFLFIFFIALLYSIFLSLSFPRLSTAAYPCTNPGRKKKSSECHPMAKMAAKYKESKLAPARISRKLTMESMPVLLEEGCPTRLTL